MFISGAYPTLYIQNSSIVADVGGHVGYFAVWATVMNPMNEIHSFEPDMDNIRLFKKNISCNNIDTVTLHEYGLGSEEKNIVFYQYENNALNSIYKHEWHAPIRSINVPIKNAQIELTKIQPNLLKVDVEWSEDAILGTYLSHKNSPKYLCLEFSDTQERKSTVAIDRFILDNAEYIHHKNWIVVNSERRT
jgi:FkbM family methyltransferase